MYIHPALLDCTNDITCFTSAMLGRWFPSIIPNYRGLQHAISACQEPPASLTTYSMNLFPDDYGRDIRHYGLYGIVRLLSA